MKAQQVERQMGSKNEYWHYAQQCSELAAKTENARHKQFMLAMAETWRRLATGDVPKAPYEESGFERPERRPHGGPSEKSERAG